MDLIYVTRLQLAKKGLYSLYRYSKKSQDIVVDIEQALLDNGDEDYPISGCLENLLWQRLEMNRWKKIYEHNEEQFDIMATCLQESIFDFATDKEIMSAIKEANSDKLSWKVYEVLSYNEFLKRLNTGYQEKLTELYGLFDNKKLYNIYLDYMDLFERTHYFAEEEQESKSFQDDKLGYFMIKLLHQENIDFGNGEIIDFTEGLPSPSSHWH